MGSTQWMQKNRAKMSLALPLSWASVNDNSFILQFGFALKIAGVEWRDYADLIVVLLWLIKIGIAESFGLGNGSNDLPLMVRRAS